MKLFEGVILKTLNKINHSECEIAIGEHIYTKTHKGKREGIYCADGTVIYVDYDNSKSENCVKRDFYNTFSNGQDVYVGESSKNKSVEQIIKTAESLVGSKFRLDNSFAEGIISSYRID